MYTGMYSSQQEATNKRLVRLFELITNIFIKCLKPYKLFPLLKVFFQFIHGLASFIKENNDRDAPSSQRQGRTPSL